MIYGKGDAQRLPYTIFSFVLGALRIENIPADGLVLTHLQKYARAFFIVNCVKGKRYAPDYTVHGCFTFKFQEGNDEDGWVPSSEVVIYFRSPGFREDKELGMKWTWGYFGFHLD